MILTTEQTEALKQIELDIFKEFIGVCEKLGLKYYVLGGTLLGAVRHKGFIPWDDDIDVGMPRQDYEILISQAQRYLPEHLFLQTHATDGKYLKNYAKIRNSNTAFIEESISHVKMNHGMFIDIFPLDYCDEKNKYKNFRGISNVLINLRMFAETNKDPLPFVKRLATIVSRVRYPSVEQAYQAKEKRYKCCKSGSFLANFSGAWGIKEIIPAEWYSEGVILEFEGIAVYAPKEYQKWLTRVYGDYMQLPPEEKRVTHHLTTVVDVTKSYLHYIKEF